MSFIDDGGMTPKCATCPKWKDSKDGEDSTCSLPKYAAVTDCPYFRELIFKKCKENKQE